MGGGEAGEEEVVEAEERRLRPRGRGVAAARKRVAK